MVTVVDLMQLLKKAEVAPGEALPEALARAHAYPGTGFVHQWRGVEGWHATDCIPPIHHFFKVSHGRIYACFKPNRADYSERLIGCFKGTQIQMEDSLA